MSAADNRYKEELGEWQHWGRSSRRSARERRGSWNWCHTTRTPRWRRWCSPAVCDI